MSVLSSIGELFLVFVLAECSKQAFFRIHKQKYLADHVIETKQAESDFQCGLLCARHGSCASVNYKTSGIGKGRCELNSKTNQEITDNDETRNHEFNHLVIIKPVSKNVAMFNNAVEMETYKTQDATGQRALTF